MKWFNRKSFYVMCCDAFLFIVSELQEEGMNAINLPLSPTPFELDPEDTMLGKIYQFYLRVLV